MKDNEEIPDQAAFLSCIWDYLPDDWKNLDFQELPKTAIMLPSEGFNAIPTPVQYCMPRLEGSFSEYPFTSYSEIFNRYGVNEFTVKLCGSIAQAKVYGAIDGAIEMMRCTWVDEMTTRPYVRSPYAWMTPSLYDQMKERSTEMFENKLLRLKPIFGVGIWIGNSIIETMKQIEKPMRKDYDPFVIWPVWTIKTKLLNFYRTPGMWWIRILGIGLKCKDIRLFRLMFSERYGFSGIIIGNYHLKFLK